MSLFLANSFVREIFVKEFNKISTNNTIVNTKTWVDVGFDE